jgi:hypothetical protein
LQFAKLRLLHAAVYIAVLGRETLEPAGVETSGMKILLIVLSLVLVAIFATLILSGYKTSSAIAPTGKMPWMSTCGKALSASESEAIQIPFTPKSA